MINNNKILITGGSGFIGTNILNKIKNTNSNIFATYHNSKNFYKVDNVQYIKSKLYQVINKAAVDQLYDFIFKII